MTSNKSNNIDKQRKLYRMRVIFIVLLVTGFITAMTFAILSTFVDDIDTSKHYGIAAGVIMGVVGIAFIIAVCNRMLNPMHVFKTRAFRKGSERASKRMGKFVDAMVAESDYEKNRPYDYDPATVPYTTSNEPEREEIRCNFCGTQFLNTENTCPKCGKSV